MIIASIDIGTNTVLLLIAKADRISNSLESLYTEYRMPRIGRGLKPGDAISEKKITQLLSVLAHYSNIIKKYNCQKIIVTATNAFRLASNSEEISERILIKFNFNVNIISGDTEAEFAFLGALSGTQFKSSTLVIDIGGGSTELILGDSSEIIFKRSFPIGSVIATEKFLKHSPPLPYEIEQLESNIKDIFEEIMVLSKSQQVIAVAGTATTIACMVKGLKEFEESIVDRSELSFLELKYLISAISILTPKQIKDEYGNVLVGREDIILGGALILGRLMKILDSENVVVSSRGIRYGAIINYLKNSS